MTNLHVHSQYSGREYLPAEEQLLREFESGNTILSITDHNCVKANPIALLMSKEYGFRYIPGIEMDCTFKNRNISVLGYGIDSNSREFDDVDEKAEDAQYRASLERLCETQAMGFHITEDELWKIAKEQYHPGHWTGKMFAEALFSKPEYFNSPVLQRYQLKPGSMAECYDAFTHDFYEEGALCYVKIDYMQVSEAIRRIHRNGGKAVLSVSETCRIDTDDIPELFDYHLDFIDFYNHYYMNSTDRVLFGSLSHHLAQEYQYF